MSTMPTVKGKKIIIASPEARGGASAPLSLAKAVTRVVAQRSAEDGLAQMFANLRGDQNLIYLTNRLQNYAETCEARLRALREAVEAGDMTQLEDVAHALTETTARVGAVTMMKLCIALQMMGRRGLLPKAESLLVDLEREYLRFKQSLMPAVG